MALTGQKRTGGPEEQTGRQETGRGQVLVSCGQHDVVCVEMGEDPQLSCKPRDARHRR